MLRLFFEKIDNGSLQIRKTREPNHAKMYIFEYREKKRKGEGAVITGSSNLTYSGMGQRQEVNVELGHDQYQEALSIFNELWEDSVEITSEDFSQNVKKQIWLDQTPTPYLLFLRVLDEYFCQDNDLIFLPQSITEGRYQNLTYQVDAIKHTIQTIKKHNGVIIADVVGLGKSIIAATAAHNLNTHTLIICPPHLIPQWEEYKSDMKINARVYSSGLLDKIISNMIEGREYLVIIDEAHKYRNENTVSYGLLHRICQGNKVMLLTATPFNNKPDDLYAMLKLFQVPGSSTIATVDNLHSSFRDLIARYKSISRQQKKDGFLNEKTEKDLDNLAHEMRRIVAPVIIRRTRQDLLQIKKYAQNLKEQKIVFPRMADPVLLEYPLGELTQQYLNTLESINPSGEGEKGFIGARYMPLVYLKEDKLKQLAKEFNAASNDVEFMTDSQHNLAAFMRRLIVARFESSLAAFKITLENMIASSENILKWYSQKKVVPLWKRGQIPDPDDISFSGEADSFEYEDFLFEQKISNMQEKGFITINAEFLKPSFAQDLQKDIQMLQDISSKWAKISSAKDPKLAGIKKELEKQLKKEPSRKIIIFSQYADTVDYLFDNLSEIKTLAYTSRHKSSTRETLLANFDATYHTTENQYQVLVATDAISEGYNLSRAGTIINYDIPYNPVKVIQRIGRINRVNAKSFEQLYTYNFFPSPKGEKEIRIKAISTLKMALIGKLMGQDSKVLEQNETIHSPFGKMFSDLYQKQEETTWDVEYRNLIDSLRENDPNGLLASASNLPCRTRLCRKFFNEKEKGLLVFGKKGDDSVFRFIDENKNQTALSPEMALALFKAEPAEIAMLPRAPFHELLKAVTEKMFDKKITFSLDIELQKSLEIVKVLKQEFKKEADYLNDLHRAIKDFGGLTSFHLKQIRNILKKGKITGETIDLLKKEIPHNYIRSIINTDKQDQKEETIIIAEQFF
jgi:superfamily II DNA or RNA helicase